jgi:hypothetical protein
VSNWREVGLEKALAAVGVVIVRQPRATESRGLKEKLAKDTE